MLAAAAALVQVVLRGGGGGGSEPLEGLVEAGPGVDGALVAGLVRGEVGGGGVVAAHAGEGRGVDLAALGGSQVVAG